MSAPAASPPPTEASPVAAAVNAVANVASGAVNAVTNAASAVSGAVTGAVNSATNMFSNVAATPANNKKNDGGFTFNSLIPLGNSPKPANNRPANNRPANGNGFFGNAGNQGRSAANVGVNNAPPTFGNVSVTAITNSPWALPIGIFVGLVVLFLTAFTLFDKQIKQGYQYLLSSTQQNFGLNSQPPVQASVTPVRGSVTEITMPPSPPQAVTPAQHAASHQTLAEKILPSGGTNEVYNVAQNKFTYYDAEPLCKALGAELATYEQVKTAWTKGADWCNYGWVKGQMAIYPTQQGTYDKLQSGPENERMACGTTGINGGHFDNPDMLYGVNCYGKKPAQSAHDEEKLMDEGKIPKSPATLKVDQMVNEFKTQADSLFVKPFNDNKWSTK